VGGAYSELPGAEEDSGGSECLGEGFGVLLERCYLKPDARFDCSYQFIKRSWYTTGEFASRKILLSVTARHVSQGVDLLSSLETPTPSNISSLFR
jgi:hypothetical protein